MTCSKGHRYIDDLMKEVRMQDISPNQGDLHNERHKCAGCAYVDGLKDALIGNPKKAALDNTIPKSQAGVVRHKDAWGAYLAGFEYGSKIIS